MHQYIFSLMELKVSRSDTPKSVVAPASVTRLTVTRQKAPNTVVTFLDPRYTTRTRRKNRSEEGRTSFLRERCGNITIFVGDQQ